MRASDRKLTESLEAGARVTAHTTRVGGQDVTEQVQSWQLERSYSTDLPDAMRAFSGSSAAQLQLQLSGSAGTSAPALYSPWAPRSTGDAVRPGQSVVHTHGTDAGTLPAFRGSVRNRSAASGTDTVRLTALDGAERLHGPAELPKPYAGFYWRRPVATATWCVDELLRQAGLHSAPPPRYPEFSPTEPLTLVYASLHGGFAATYGQPEIVPDPRHYSWTRAGAPHEMALVPHAAAPDTASLTATWFPRSRVTVPGSRLLAEAWVNNAVGFGSTVALEMDLNRTGTSTGRLRLAFDFAAGKVYMHSGTREGAGWYFSWTFAALKEQRGVFHIGGVFDTVAAGTSVLPTVKPYFVAPDGTRYHGTATAFTEASAAQPSAELYQLRLVTQLATEAVQLTSGLPAVPTFDEFDQRGEWTKEALLDDAILPLHTIPRVSGSQWEVITQIAKASMSTAEFDERGVFHWRNHTRFTKVPTAPDLTLTSVRDIASLTVTEEIDACRNYCVQPYKDWTSVTVTGGTAYTDTVVRQIPGNTSVTLKYVLADEEFDVGPPNVDDDQSVAPGFSVRFAAVNAAGAEAVKGAVDILARREEGHLVLRLTNRTSQRLYTISEDGRPSVHIQTLKPSKEPVERQATSWASGSASERFYGRQEFHAEASDWVQDYRAAQDLASAMRAAGQYPVPVLGEVEVLYDPRIQLGDVVRVVDSSGAALDTYAWVVGIKTQSSGPGTVQQTLTLRGTRTNGVPADSGLTPDTPSDRTPLPAGAAYTDVSARYPTLGDLTASRLTWRAIKENGL
ncbi:hypothetical protein [Streptomyces thermolilacinus]|uniref:hypothetical protein n=1 Tax=Streptomyces thermolilacinus TaxID=285540 RepID=UPI0033C22D70